MLLAFALSLVLAPQEPSFERGDPSGVVVDEQGNGVAGAEVTIVRVPVQSSPSFELAIDQLLARAPLPKVTTRTDGGYVLPLTRDQRRLGAMPGDGRFVLRVTKPGYGSETETLETGIASYLGSRIVLRRPLPEDRIELQVEDTRPGMLVSLYAWTQWGSEPGEILEVPESGRLSATCILRSAQFDPCDLAPAPGLWLMARVICPGRCSAPLVVRPCGEVISLPRNDSRESVVRPVSRSDGKELTGVRGRYRARDGSERWFPLSAEGAPDEPALRLVAIAADGCRERRCAESDALVLTPLNEPEPSTGEPCTVRILDSNGCAVPGATLRFSDSSYTAGALPEGAEVTGADGSVPISRLPTGWHVLTVIAEGFLAKRVMFEHAAHAEPQLIEIESADSVQIVTVDESGRPVADVWIHEGMITGEFRDWRIEPPRRTRSDSLGRAIMSVPRGRAWVCTVARESITSADARKPSTRVVVPAASRSVVRVPSGTMRSFEFRDGASRTSVVEPRPFFHEPPTALLVRGFTHADGALSLGIIDAPPVRVTAGDLATGGAGLDRRKFVRRVPLILPEPFAELRIVATLFEPNGDPDPALGNAAVREADGSWSFVSHDLGAWRCLAIASGYEPFSFTMPARAADGREPPFTLALKRKP